MSKEMSTELQILNRFGWAIGGLLLEEFKHQTDEEREKALSFFIPFDELPEKRKAIVIDQFDWQRSRLGYDFWDKIWYIYYRGEGRFDGEWDNRRCH